MRNYGLILEQPASEDYMFGSAQTDETIINPSGDWTDFLPLIEYQKKGTCESMSCVSFATLTCLEILVKYIYGFEVNMSDRFTAIMSDTTQQGNSPNKVAQSIRHHGTVEEMFLPFTEKILTWEEYMSPKPMKKEYVHIGEEWAEDWTFTHEWVASYPKMIASALKRSPLAVSVYAWREKNGVFYKNTERDNHFCVLYKMNEDGTYKIFDTYDKTHKTLKADYKFTMIKRFGIKRNPTVIKDNWLKDIFKKLFNFIKDICKN